MDDLLLALLATSHPLSSSSLVCQSSQSPTGGSAPNLPPMTRITRAGAGASSRSTMSDVAASGLRILLFALTAGERGGGDLVREDELRAEVETERDGEVGAGAGVGPGAATAAKEGEEVVEGAMGAGVGPAAGGVLSPLVSFGFLVFFLVGSVEVCAGPGGGLAG